MEGAATKSKASKSASLGESLGPTKADCAAVRILKVVCEQSLRVPFGAAAIAVKSEWPSTRATYYDLWIHDGVTRPVAGINEIISDAQIIAYVDSMNANASIIKEAGSLKVARFLKEQGFEKSRISVVHDELLDMTWVGSPGVRVRDARHFLKTLRYD
ncbi:MAG: hypothetical protein KGH53_01750 [Candidatus Micrarchaeota archaeon]|nr:hypothetical protein [Candidatus Micrarchaeota archaeon]